MRFEWDDEKNRTNIKKHGISFELASRIFCDPDRIERWDEEHSSFFEERYITIGKISGTLVIVVVVYTARRNALRIISARRADRKEELIYYGNGYKDDRP